jgi:hypothetical protein
MSTWLRAIFLGSSVYHQEQSSFDLLCLLFSCLRGVGFVFGKGREAAVNLESKNVEGVFNFWLLARILDTHGCSLADWCTY